jgi:hypothetical protein
MAAPACPNGWSELMPRSPRSPEMRIGSSALAASIAMLVSCSSGSPAPTIPPTRPATLRPGPSQGPTATPALDTSSWKTFTNKRWGYSLRYPPTWFALPASGPDTQANLSNQNVGAPLAMSAGGVFLSVDVDPGTSSCASQVPPGLIERRYPISFGGVVTTDLVAMAPGPGAHGANWTLATSALLSGICYYFSFISYDRHTRDASVPVARGILESFVLLGG